MEYNAEAIDSGSEDDDGVHAEEEEEPEEREQRPTRVIPFLWRSRLRWAGEDEDLVPVWDDP